MERISYIRFSNMSVKARMNMVQKVLCNLGYDVIVNNTRDKKTVKAITDIQSKNGLSPNGIICEKTFNLLKIEV